MSYLERLREDIQFKSPEGNEFTALWRGNERTIPKKVAISRYPRVVGSSAQDLDADSMMYPIPIYFEGPDNDLEADAFMQAWKQRGVWEVTHPVNGLLKLQPLTATELTQPITEGNLTKINTEWMEPIDPAVVPSEPELQSRIASKIDEVNEVSAEQLEQSTFQKTAAEIGAFRQSVLDGVAVVQNTLQSVSDVSATITAEMESITRDINTVLAVVPLDMIAIAGQLQQLIQLPAQAIDNVEARLDAYQNLADQISFTLTPDTPTTSGYNKVAVQELCLTALFCAVSDVSSTGQLLSRTEAVGIMQGNLDLFNNATNVLDASQTLFDAQPIDRQYFSQSQSYVVSASLNALTLAYLLRSAFDLKVEKRFVLSAPANPVRIAMREYEGTGVGDINIDFFMETNKIEVAEFAMMPKGRELVVYV